MEREAYAMRVSKLRELAMGAGYGKDRWDQFGYSLKEGVVVIGSLSDPENALLTLDDIESDLEEDPQFAKLSFEEQGRILVWCDESEVNDPEGITFAYLTSEDVEKMRALERH